MQPSVPQWAGVAVVAAVLVVLVATVLGGGGPSGPGQSSPAPGASTSTASPGATTPAPDGRGGTPTATVAGAGEATTPSVSAGPDLPYLRVPEGFRVEVFADAEELGGEEAFSPGPRPGVRVLRFHEGTLYASVPQLGSGTDRLVALPDDDGDGTVDRVVTVLESPEIRDVHGFDFHDGHLYLVNADSTENNSIVRYEVGGMGVDASTATVLNDDLPGRGDSFHWTRTLEVHEGQIYVTVGSDSNVDEPTDEWYARMTRCDLDGTGCVGYATGLRNSVDFVFHDGRLFATDNGRDGLGADAPPDEVNVVREGADYGYPYCYGQNVPDPAWDDPSKCRNTTGPAVEIPPHEVPLGLTFYTGSAFPEAFRGDLYVALHGSYSTDPPVGYELVRIPYEDGELGTPVAFVTGWYESDGDANVYESGEDVRGRPVDVVVGPDGAMYLSDDASGRIYRIWYAG